jgi:hypothetical protein
LLGHPDLRRRRRVLKWLRQVAGGTIKLGSKPAGTVS